jgi:hypothetical protein
MPTHSLGNIVLPGSSQQFLDPVLAGYPLRVDAERAGIHEAWRGETCSFSRCQRRMRAFEWASQPVARETAPARLMCAAWIPPE